MKAWKFTVVLVLVNLSASVGQTPDQSNLALAEFGHQFYLSLTKKDPTILYPLLYKREDLMATVRKHVRNEELKSQMLESMDVAEFDGNVVAECVSRHARLMGRTEIDWEKIRFEDFKFEPDTLQSHKYEIEVGSGYLYFSFAGTTYNIKVDKMAKLVTGWRGHEFGSSYRVANPNAASTSK